MKRKLTACLLVCVAVIMLCACGRHLPAVFAVKKKPAEAMKWTFGGDNTISAMIVILHWKNWDRVCSETKTTNT